MDIYYLIKIKIVIYRSCSKIKWSTQKDLVFIYMNIEIIKQGTGQV